MSKLFSLIVVFFVTLGVGAVKADILRQSSTDVLTEHHLMGMSRVELRLARNEIFARHGYIFKSEDLSAYFQHQSWYDPNYAFSVDLLSQLEKQNVAFIKKYEESGDLFERLSATQPTTSSQGVVSTSENVGRRDATASGIANFTLRRANVDVVIGQLASDEAICKVLLHPVFSASLEELDAYMPSEIFAGRGIYDEGRAANWLGSRVVEAMRNAGIPPYGDKLPTGGLYFTEDTKRLSEAALSSCLGKIRNASPESYRSFAAISGFPDQFGKTCGSTNDQEQSCLTAFQAESFLFSASRRSNSGQAPLILLLFTEGHPALLSALDRLYQQLPTVSPSLTVAASENASIEAMAEWHAALSEARRQHFLVSREKQQADALAAAAAGGSGEDTEFGTGRATEDAPDQKMASSGEDPQLKHADDLTAEGVQANRLPAWTQYINYSDDILVVESFAALPIEETISLETPVTVYYVLDVPSGGPGVVVDGPIGRSPVDLRFCNNDDGDCLLERARSINKVLEEQDVTVISDIVVKSDQIVDQPLPVWFERVDFDGPAYVIRDSFYLPKFTQKNSKTPVVIFYALETHSGRAGISVFGPEGRIDIDHVECRNNDGACMLQQAQNLNGVLAGHEQVRQELSEQERYDALPQEEKERLAEEQAQRDAEAARKAMDASETAAREAAEAEKAALERMVSDGVPTGPVLAALHVQVIGEAGCDFFSQRYDATASLVALQSWKHITFAQNNMSEDEIERMKESVRREIRERFGRFVRCGDALDWVQSNMFTSDLYK